MKNKHLPRLLAQVGHATAHVDLANPSRAWPGQLSFCSWKLRAVWQFYPYSRGIYLELTQRGVEAHGMSPLWRVVAELRKEAGSS